MPTRPARSKLAAVTAGAANATEPEPSPTPAALAGDHDHHQRNPKIKFTLLLEESAADKFDRIVHNLRRFGRRGGRYAAKSDVVRAMIEIIEDDPELADRIGRHLFPDTSWRGPTRRPTP